MKPHGRIVWKKKGTGWRINPKYVALLTAVFALIKQVLEVIMVIVKR